MPKRLIVLYDGTWNNRESATNVHKVKLAIPERDPQGVEQRVFYDEGVGTRRFDSLRGAFGYGISKNILQGYEFLATNWQPGDQVFLFGFSRGAYTARSLVGFIRKCGLLKSFDAKQAEDAYENIYRNKDVAPEAPRAVELRRQHSIPLDLPGEADGVPQEGRFVVRFIGVWDTVGALGVPLSGISLPWFSGYYRWHDTELSSLVRHAFHAIALDEGRKDYDVAVWTNRDNPGQKKAAHVEVEQRWFVGAHSDVGGGYDEPRELPQLARRWLEQKAAGCGLHLEPATLALPLPLPEVAPTDSYKKFMFGIYRLIKLGDRFDRPFGAGIHETVDESVSAHMKHYSWYRPPTLKHLWPSQ